MWVSKVIEATNEIAESFRTREIVLLTESDLKTSLSNKIKKKFTGSITVNTESPWYESPDSSSPYYIDITAYDRDKLQVTYDPSTRRKGYKYDDEALAIELKYFRHIEDIQEIAGDFKKMQLLIKAPKNDCFIIAAARTKELFEAAQLFMQRQMNDYRNEYNSRVKVYLFGTEEFVEIT